MPERALTEAGRARPRDEKSTVEIFRRRVAGRRSSVGTLTLTSRLIEGEFPNYRQLLPEAYESRLTVSRQQLLDAVRRVGLLARDTTPVRHGVQRARREALDSSARISGRPSRRSRLATRARTSTVAFNPQYLVDGLDGGHGRDGAAGRARRAEAGRGPRRGRRVHVPGDAGPAAGGGRARRPGSQASPDAPRVGRAARLPQPRRHAPRPAPDGLIVGRGSERRGQDQPARGRSASCYALASPRTSSSTRRSCATGPRPPTSRGESRRGRQGARRGRGPPTGREPREGQPFSRCGASAICAGRCARCSSDPTTSTS